MEKDSLSPPFPIDSTDLRFSDPSPSQPSYFFFSSLLPFLPFEIFPRKLVCLSQLCRRLPASPFFSFSMLISLHLNDHRLAPFPPIPFVLTKLGGSIINREGTGSNEARSSKTQCLNAGAPRRSSLKIGDDPPPSSLHQVPSSDLCGKDMLKGLIDQVIFVNKPKFGLGV